MQSHPWDFFLVVFAEPHPAGHYFWPKGAQIVDVDGSGSTEDFAALQLRDIYVAVDAAIGEIIKDCEDDVTVFIVSGDGVGPNHCAWHLLPQILSRSGFTKELSFVNAQRHLKGSLIHRLRDAIPSRLRAEIAAQLPWQLRDRLAHQLTAGKIDWSRTVAFSLPADLEGCVRINLRGREPQGVVEPGGQYEDICAELTEVLEQLVNPLTGRRAVRRVCQVDHLFPGARRDHLPDLTVIWNDEAEINEVYSERLGLVSEASVDPRTGTHYPRSFIAVRGPRTERGKKIEGGHIADLAPSFLAKFGIDRPSEMDGRALDIFQ
jgi:predicted AlkP superfamily phosphohydrolase/phosphomutase